MAHENEDMREEVTNIFREEGFEVRTTTYVPPKFVRKPGSSFSACVLMRDDREEGNSFYHLCAIEPAECLDERGNIIAVGPGEMFTFASETSLDEYFGLGVYFSDEGIKVLDPKYEELLKHELETLPDINPVTLTPIDRILR